MPTVSSSVLQGIIGNSPGVQAGLPPSWVSSMLGTESNNNTSAVSQTGVRGIAQITQGTWDGIYPNGPAYTTDTTAQVNAASVLLNTYYQKYDGDATLAAIAYNAGPSVANTAQRLIHGGDSEADAVAQSISSLPLGKQKEVYREIAHFTPGTDQTPNPELAAGEAAVDAKINQYGVDDSAAGVTTAVYGTSYSPQQAARLVALANPPLVIQTGLDEVPWFQNTDLVQENSRLTANKGYPVSFRVYYDRALTAPLAPTGGSPISIVLKASLAKFEKSIKTVTMKKTTRTAMRVVMWGMQPDVITGSGSTGVFMNQTGVSDYLSIVDPGSDVKNLFVNGRRSPLAGNGTPNTPNNPTLSADSLRVAAKDAFVEFLSLFENNGVVWFRHNEFTSVTISATPDAAAAISNTAPLIWSQNAGSSTFQMTARNNDVYTRGFVVMEYRNAVYSGYFKSLSFEMDAERPFSWNFSFAFQVERTLTAVPVAPGGSLG